MEFGAKAAFASEPELVLCDDVGRSVPQTIRPNGAPGFRIKVSVKAAPEKLQLPARLRDHARLLGIAENRRISRPPTRLWLP